MPSFTAVSATSSRSIRRCSVTGRLSDGFSNSSSTTNAPLHIVDVGSGAGDMLRRVESWAHRNNISVRLTGIDRNPFAARAAREFSAPHSRIEWVSCDAFTYQPPAKIDVVISSLFTHHLPDQEIVRFLQWMEQVSVARLVHQ